MVAYPCDTCTAFNRRNNFSLKRHCCSPVYLYGILMKKDSSQKTLETLSVLALFFLILFTFFKISWAVYVSIFLLALSLFENPLSEFISASWLNFSKILGKISNFIILCMVFYALITPLALIWRLFNKKEFRHFLSNKNTSVFEDVDRDFSQNYFEKTF